MNKEDLYFLIGKYLNGYKIVKIEEDPFIKGQINLWTDEWITEYFGDKSMVKFFVGPEGNSSRIYKELVDKENKQLKNNWNKLKDYFNARIEVCDNRLSNPFCNFEKATKERLIFSQCLEKLEELEQGSDK